MDMMKQAGAMLEQAGEAMADLGEAMQGGDTGVKRMGRIIGDNRGLVIKQRVSAAEAITGGCCEIENVYSMYAKDDAKLENKLLEAREFSFGFERCCCNPYHSALLHVSDGKGGPTLVTVERVGALSGKLCMPYCCVIMDCCADGVVLHDGHVAAKPKTDCCMCIKGGLDVQAPNAVSMIRQSTRTMCTPKLEVYQEADSISPYADITGPMCFGGCSELCCDSKFLYKKRGDGKNIAHMKKLAPKTCMDACAEMFTDADKFLVEFGDDVSHEEKANAVAATFLTDYMFFEKDNGMCSCLDNCTRVKFTCCLVYCCGCLCPCTVDVVLSKASDAVAPE